MILDADALEILAYLKTSAGKYFSLSEISRRAAGKKRFEENANWARNLVPILLEAGHIEVNARGHYRVPPPAKTPAPVPKDVSHVPRKPRGRIVGDDYFPETVSHSPRIVGGDYFPSNE